MASVARALERIKHDLDPHLPPAAIESACAAAGHRWRARKLGPVATVHLFVLQVLHGNTAIRHLRHLAAAAGASSSFSAAAYCGARARLPVAVLQDLLRTSAASLRDALGAGGNGNGGGGGGDPSWWRGHRTLLVDGSATLVPDTPALRRAYPLTRNQKPGCSLPVPRVLGLFDAATGLVAEMLAFSLFVHERARVLLLHPLLAAGDLVVGDRGFCSYAHLAVLAGRGVLACFRLHKTQVVCFRPHRRHYDPRKGHARGQSGRPRSRWVRRLGRGDQVVRWIRPAYDRGGRATMTRARFDALPDELEVREVRYRVAERGYRTREVTVVTTLLDPARYPKDAIAELYGIRWRVETHFAQLKTTLGMDRLKCATPDGVLKEVAAYCLAYNLVRAAIVRAAARQGTTPDRVGFVDALRWLLAAAPGEALVDLVINPPRPGRFHPRVVKRVDRTHPKMTRPRHKYKPRPAVKADPPK
jgi:hypothetical protein